MLKLASRAKGMGRTSQRKSYGFLSLASFVTSPDMHLHVPLATWVLTPAAELLFLVFFSHFSQTSPAFQYRYQPVSVEEVLFGSLINCGFRPILLSTTSLWGP